MLFCSKAECCQIETARMKDTLNMSEHASSILLAKRESVRKALLSVVT